MSPPLKIAYVVSHPIQYHVPFFRELAGWDGVTFKVFFTWHADPGGAYDQGFGRHVAWDVPLLDGYEHEVCENAAKDPGTHHFFGIRGADLLRRLQAWGVHVVVLHGYNYAAHLNALFAFRRVGIPVLLRGDSHLLGRQSAFKQLLKNLLLPRIFAKASGCLYCGTHNKAYFAHFGVDDAQLFYCPQGVENARFIGNDAVLESEAREWRQSLGIHENDDVILYCGKFQPVKNPAELLFAAALLKGNAVLVMVGEGDLERELRERATALRHKVIFLPFQNQQRMPLVYRLGDVTVLPSRSETWGLAVNESLCCARPVIVSDKVGSAPDLVLEGRSGWVYPGEDVAALADCLDRFLQMNAEERSTLRHAARSHIAGWDVSETAMGIVNACRQINEQGALSRGQH